MCVVGGVVCIMATAATHASTYDARCYYTLTSHLVVHPLTHYIETD